MTSGSGRAEAGAPAELRALAAVRAVKGPVVRLGGAFMSDAATREAGAALGLSGWSYYHAGRAGVLGDVDPAVVVAAEVFFPPDRVASAWAKARAVGPVTEAARSYADQCHRWGREHLTDVAGAARLAELGERVVAAADPAGLPLFAAWRAVPLPDDPPARLAQVLHVLREHRGGLHGVAVLAAGLTPLEAILAGAHGTAGATFFGWREPFGDPEPWRARRDEAEELTDRLTARAYAALGDADLEELVTLSGALRDVGP